MAPPRSDDLPYGEQRSVIVGTAGHIDHGKTSLVQRLTGRNTDRLPAEQERGISIDLGFAQWKTAQFQFGIVDVPGHERFIKNMVAGATGIDLALLVVAADDGVMPQTREHLDILDLLGVRGGLVVMTKIDLVDPDYQDLVEHEIRELVAGTCLSQSPVIRLSTATGAGWEQLISALQSAAAQLSHPPERSIFRMPIDQVFSITGHGTVVTGTVLGGQVARDDLVEVLPRRTTVRVRAVQHHGSGTAQAAAHRRTGVNLAAIKPDELHRGCELATPGYLQPSSRLLVSIKNLKHSPVDIKDRQTLRLHLGTSETTVRVILKGWRIGPGETACAELRLLRPVVAEYGQCFILRRASPSLTLAGGQILDPLLEPRLRLKELQAVGLSRQASDPSARLSALLEVSLRDQLSHLEIACRIGIEPAAVGTLLEQLERQQVLYNWGTPGAPRWVHQHRIARLRETATRAINLVFAQHQPRRMLPLAILTSAVTQAVGEAYCGPLLNDLRSIGWLSCKGDLHGPAGLQVHLSKRQLELQRAALDVIQAAALAPPNLKELALELGQPLDKLGPLLELAIDNGHLVQIAEDLYFAPQALDKARRVSARLLTDPAGATVAQLRDAWQITRKHAFPLCEWLHAQQITERIGDTHFAGPKFKLPP